MPASSITTTTEEETTRKTRPTYEFPDETTTTEITTTEPITTTVTTKTTKTTKATAGKTTKKTTKAADTEPLYIKLRIQYVDGFVFCEFVDARGGVLPYSYELRLYKNGELVSQSNDADHIIYGHSPTEPAMFKVYGKFIDATGDFIEAEREMSWNL